MTQPTRVALVTGGAQGIGRAITLRLLADGWRVAVADRDVEAGRELVGDQAQGRPVPDYVEMDVGDEASVAAGLGAVLARHGRLDAVVNNAAIASPYNPPVGELKLEYWDAVLRANLSSVFLVTKHAVAALRATGGSIVNIASTRALQSEPNTEAYTAAKGGVVALTHALAVSLGPAVRVNAVSPGWIDTGPWQKASARHDSEITDADHAQHPVGRVGRPEDVAALTAWLLSQEAGFVTGQSYVLDGGMTRRMVYLD